MAAEVRGREKHPLWPTRGRREVPVSKRQQQQAKAAGQPGGDACKTNVILHTTLITSASADPG